MAGKSKFKGATLTGSGRYIVVTDITSEPTSIQRADWPDVIIEQLNGKGYTLAPVEPGIYDLVVINRADRDVEFAGTLSIFDSKLVDPAAAAPDNGVRPAGKRAKKEEPAAA